MKEILLSKGYIAFVDDDDFERIAAFKWSVSGDPNKGLYALACTGFYNGKSRFRLMHRLILNAAKGQIIDHIDRDGLNNQKANLRFCTYRENNINRSTRSNASGYRGVERLIWNGGDQYRVRLDQKHIATFNDKKTAAHTYDCVARIRHGRFARVNFPYRWPEGPRC